MERDIRGTALYQEIEALYTSIRQPGTGQISDVTEIHASPDGRFAAFAGAIVDRLEGAVTTRICITDLGGGDTRVLTFGPNTDRLPKWSPDGRYIAFLSDRDKAGDFQLYIVDPTTGAARRCPRVQGWVEYLQWSPDSKKVLLGVAGHGADVAGPQGAVTSDPTVTVVRAWMPSVETGSEVQRWRSAWIYTLEPDQVTKVSREDCNVWEAAWCGSAQLVAITSPGPSEGLWYSARLHAIQLDTGGTREVYAARDQLGCVSASPSGNRIAVVEGICSDRWVMAGELCLIETLSGKIERVDTNRIDVSYVEWRSDHRLLVAGHREFGTAVGMYDVVSRTFAEVWCSAELTTGGFYASVSGLGDAGDCVLVGESFTRAPEIVVIRKGVYQPVESFDLGYSLRARAIEAVERICWEAPDGLEIQGWLLLPNGQRPHPLVMLVHGGPVWHWRQTRAGAVTLMLVKQGYAVFLPNPRGSSGRGREYARFVVGDMGGADTHDFLSGLDHLVEQGIADPRRLGVTGGSYGGFMTAWLVTQDSRFAAAVSVAPTTNQVSQHLVSNIPDFIAMFLSDHYANPGGRYFSRSPIMHAAKVKTPTLSLCGALDRCTPPEEAMQFHRALLENGVKSALVTYPQEGHGVRKWPAAIDYTTRIVAWFEEHMPATRAGH